jgi:hypothetical protein
MDYIQNGRINATNIEILCFSKDLNQSRSLYTSPKLLTLTGQATSQLLNIPSPQATTTTPQYNTQIPAINLKLINNLYKERTNSINTLNSLKQQVQDIELRQKEAIRNVS